MAYYDHIDGLEVVGQREDFADGCIIEGADGDRAESERFGLEVDVLGGVAGLHIDVANAAFAVAFCCSCEPGCEDQCQRSGLDKSLSPGG